ncbi:MAG TPA: hypothetical protein VGJ35_02630, partial [Burkholderiaceae bacterium]
MPVHDNEIAAAIAALSPEERQQLEAALGAQGQDTSAHAPATEQFGLNKATGLSAVPPLQSRRIPGTDIDLPFSVADMAEFLPAAVAGGATYLATRQPGAAAVVGSAAGEAGRQLLRRAFGAPAAPGVMQRALDLDPNSPPAAAVSLGGEAAAGVAGAGFSKLLGALGRGAEQSAERSIVRDILGGARTEREVAEAPALAKRAQAAGILRSITKRSRLARAQEALSVASKDAAAKTTAARQAGATVEAGPVLDAIQNELPAAIPGSGAPRRAVAA